MPDNVTTNQALIRGFLRSAPKVLKRGGQVQLALKRGEPYDKWGFETLLEESPFERVCSYPPPKYQGYQHSWTLGSNYKCDDDRNSIVHTLRLKGSGAGSGGLNENRESDTKRARLG